MGKPYHIFMANNKIDPINAWDSEHYAGPTYASNAPKSSDSGLLYFGVVESDNGITLVLDPTSNESTCQDRTRTVAGDIDAYHVVYGDPTYIRIFVKHVESLLGFNKDTADEVNSFFCVLRDSYPMLGLNTIRSCSIAAVAQPPQAHRYPDNVSEQARSIWDAIVQSRRYLDSSSSMYNQQKWILATKMFLDKCNRLGISPFHSNKPIVLEDLNKRYLNQRTLASQLERQIYYNMESLGLIASLDAGAWKYLKTAYTDKRYVVVLETRWLVVDKDINKIVKHIVGTEHFSKSEHGGWEHNVSPTCKLVLRIKKYPSLSLRMQFSFSKDILKALGVVGRNTDEMIEGFEDIARDWARSKRFHKVKKQ